MSLILGVLRLYFPGVVRNRIMEELFRGTAAAFEVPVPKLKGRSPEERLHAYALFTRELAEQALQDGQRSSEVRARLYENALALGGKARRMLRVGSLHEVMAAGKVLYRVLGIEFCPTADGEIEIPRCFFSRYYTSEVCRLLSALDEGVAAGLSPGRRLVFAQRLTESCSCCKAKLLVRGCEV